MGVKNQLVRLATGSSSSRARVPEDDMIEYVYIPVPETDVQERIHEKYKAILDEYWNTSQNFINGFIEIHGELMSDFQRNDINQ